MHIRSCDLLLPFAPEPLVYPVPESLSVSVVLHYLLAATSSAREFVNMYSIKEWMPVERGVWDAIRIRGQDPPDRDAMHFNGGIEAEAEGGGRREHLKDSFALFFSFRLPPSISTSLYYAIPVLPYSLGYNIIDPLITHWRTHTHTLPSAACLAVYKASGTKSLSLFSGSPFFSLSGENDS